MDDFRVGYVPKPPDPFGDRRPSGSNPRKRDKRHEDEEERQPDEDADTFETILSENQGAPAAGPIEDYYTPSEPIDPE